MDQILPWIISAIGGAVGGNVVGLFGRLRHLTPVIKTILGAAGGVAGAWGAKAAGLGLSHLQNGGLAAVIGALATSLIGRLLIRRPAAR